MSVCLCDYDCVPCMWGSLRRPEEDIRFPALELQVVVSRLTWVLGTELGCLQEQ